MAKEIKGVFRIVRGLEEDLPVLRVGELGYATDTNTLYIGDPDDGNVKINFDVEYQESINNALNEINNKVNIEPGKGLSTNDLTDELLQRILDSVSENFVINKIAEAQLADSDTQIDLSGLASIDDLNLKVDKKADHSLMSDAEILRLSTVTNYDDTDIKKDINNKADLNHHHDEYLTSIPAQYVTETQLISKGFVTNGSINTTLSMYAKSDEVPTKTSQLTNDSDFLTSVPDEYVTDDELNTTLSSYAQLSNIPIKVSQLANDKDYATTTFVEEKIVSSSTGNVDLSEYAKTETVNTQLDNKADLNHQHDEYLTEDDLTLIGDLSMLETADKSTLVTAINELVRMVSKLQNIQVFGEIITSTDSLELAEGTQGSINVKMDRFITHEQTVTISSDNPGVTVSPEVLVFTSDNYNVDQTVTVTSIQDDDSDNLTATITIKSDKSIDKTVNVSVVE